MMILRKGSQGIGTIMLTKNKLLDLWRTVIGNGGSVFSTDQGIKASMDYFGVKRSTAQEHLKSSHEIGFIKQLSGNSWRINEELVKQ